MPRPYRMGERAAQVDATRSRILEAATELYIEKGMSATTLREVGQRADVAPGTLRSHFSSREALEQAMVDRLTAAAPLPDLSIFDGARTIGDRLERLLQAGGTFLDQADALYRMWLREPMVTGPWAAKGAEYGTRWDQLMRAALGPLGDDDAALSLLRGLLEPAFIRVVRGRTRTTDEAATLISDAIGPWYRAREAEAVRASRGR